MAAPRETRNGAFQPIWVAALLGLLALTVFGVSESQDPAAASNRSMTETPAPSTPANAQSGELDIRLAPGLGNEWCVYNGQMSESTSERIHGAPITNVRNDTDKRVVLIHWDTSGQREGPVSLNVGASTSSFNGMSVGGVWEAHVTGSEADAPQRVTLGVSYKLP
jgi:hypothetical protein